jgi:hypothetical protein
MTIIKVYHEDNGDEYTIYKLPVELVLNENNEIVVNGRCGECLIPHQMEDKYPKYDVVKIRGIRTERDMTRI